HVQCASTSPTPTPTATCVFPGTHRLLVVYEDVTPPANLQSALLAQPNVAAADLWDSSSGSGTTPSVSTLQQYDTVVVSGYYDPGWVDAVALGNNLVTYMNGGGAVVALQLTGEYFYPQTQILGTWQSGGYAPFTQSGNSLSSTNTLGY